MHTARIGTSYNHLVAFAPTQNNQGTEEVLGYLEEAKTSKKICFQKENKFA